jgi:hypothetical protein
MATEAGSVEVSPAGVHTGTGIALTVYEALLAEADLVSGVDFPAALVMQKQGLARQANALAAAIWTEYGTGASSAAFVNAMWQETFGNFEFAPGDGDWSPITSWSMGQGDGAGYEVDTGLGEFLVPPDHKVRVDWHLRAKIVVAPDPAASLRARIYRAPFGEAVGSGQTFGPIANEPLLDAGTEIRFEGIVYFTTGASPETIRMEFGGLDDTVAFSPFRGALSIMRVG